MVLVGVAIAFVPGLPNVQLTPDIVFLIFLPPLLYAAAWQTPFHDFRKNLRPIATLAFGLVLVTTLVVGWVAHSIFPGMSWAAAFALGAIISPPDAIAASAATQRLVCSATSGQWSLRAVAYPGRRFALPWAKMFKPVGLKTQERNTAHNLIQSSFSMH